MKLFIISSKKFYDKIPEIKSALEELGHEITLPNCFDDPSTEDRHKKMGTEAHSRWKAGMLMHSTEVIKKNDGVLVLNFEKSGVKNYIGGATFIEMYDAFRLGKKIYLYNDVPEGILKDEINGFAPVLLKGKLENIK